MCAFSTQCATLDFRSWLAGCHRVFVVSMVHSPTRGCAQREVHQGQCRVVKKVGKQRYCILSTTVPTVHQSLPLATLSNLYVLPVVLSRSLSLSPSLSLCMYEWCVCVHICAAIFAVPVVGSLLGAVATGIDSWYWQHALVRKAFGGRQWLAVASGIRAGQWCLHFSKSIVFS